MTSCGDAVHSVAHWRVAFLGGFLAQPVFYIARLFLLKCRAGNAITSPSALTCPGRPLGRENCVWLSPRGAPSSPPRVSANCSTLSAVEVAGVMVHGVQLPQKTRSPRLRVGEAGACPDGSGGSRQESPSESLSFSLGSLISYCQVKEWFLFISGRRASFPL